MKWSWVKGIRGIVALALLTGAVSARPQAPAQQEGPAEKVAAEQPEVVAIRIVREDGQVLVESPRGIAAEIGKSIVG